MTGEQVQPISDGRLDALQRRLAASINFGTAADVAALVARMRAAEAERDKYLTAFSEQFDLRADYEAECKRLWPIEAEVERLRARLADTWDDAVRECRDLGWLHDYALSDALARNPHRAALADEEGRSREASTSAPHAACAATALRQAQAEWKSEYDRVTREHPKSTKIRAALRMASQLAGERAALAEEEGDRG